MSHVDANLFTLDLKKIKSMIEMKVNIDIFDKNQCILLIMAVKNNKCKIVRALLKAGANVHHIDSSFNNALTYAVSSQYYNIVKLLLKYGANTKQLTPDGRSMLYIAIENEDHKTVTLLLKSDVDCDEICKYVNKTYLQLAIDTNNIDIVRTLINYGADLKKTPTALYDACRNNQQDIVSLLIESKARIDSDPYQEPLMSVAAWNCNVDMMKLLLENKADINAKRYNAYTPLMLAVKKEHIGSVLYLIDHKADVKYSNDLQHSALSYAIETKNDDIIEIIQNALHMVPIVNFNDNFNNINNNNNNVNSDNNNINSVNVVISDDKNEDTCPICSEPFAKNKSVVNVAGCHHRFHLSCINEWYNTSGKATCPMCRGHIDDL